MIRAILFDVGGVLVSDDRKTFHKFLAEELNIDEAELIKIRKPYKHDLATGRMSIEEFSKIVGKTFNIDPKFPQAWKMACLESIPFDHKVISLADKLRENYRTGIISNPDDLFVQVVREAGIYKNFDPVILSSEVGYAKPDKKIFEIALEKLNLKPEECLYIDNQSEMLETPKKMGFNTIHYQSPTQLERELKELRLI